MAQTRFIRFLVLAVLIISNSACTSGIDTPQTSKAGQCANDLYPVIKGATWTYISTGNPAGNFTYTDTITESRPDGFTLTSQFTNLTRTQEWSCKPEGLLALQLGSGSVALSTTDLNAHFETVDASGVTIPANIQPGSQWQYSLNLKGSSTTPDGQTSESTNMASMSAQVIGTENVSVPAGNFNALKVQVNSTLKVTATVQGTSIPFTITSASTQWFAPGVGWVKMIEQSDFGGAPSTSTIELQSYKIP
jgi:hypothetical protein